MDPQEVCGFLDSQGRFHKTKEDYEKAEAKIKLRILENRLNHFEDEISRYLFEEYKFANYGKKREVETYILDTIAKKVLQNSNMFIEIINSKKKLQKELDIAKAELNNNLYQRWYYKFKWW